MTGRWTLLAALTLCLALPASASPVKGRTWCVTDDLYGLRSYGAPPVVPHPRWAALWRHARPVIHWTLLTADRAADGMEIAGYWRQRRTTKYVF